MNPFLHKCILFAGVSMAWGLNLLGVAAIAALGAMCSLLPWSVANFFWLAFKFTVAAAALSLLFVLAVIGWRRYGDTIMLWLAARINPTGTPLKRVSATDYAGVIMAARLRHGDQR